MSSRIFLQQREVVPMTLYKHQERALDLLADHNAFALFMEQG